MNVKEMTKRQLFSLDLLIDRLDEEELNLFRDEIIRSKRIFIAGCGRSRLSLLGFAMRLMHLGKTVYVVGDVVSPAFQKGDTLFVASASGSRESLIYIAKKAHAYGGTVNLFTSQSSSPITNYADHILKIPVEEMKESEAFKKNGVDENGGNLFEELILILSDTLVQCAADKEEISPNQLMELHANFE